MTPSANIPMKVAIMQPYFLPYIGYFQLAKAVDIFIVYDNIKFTKKGWINRNRFLQNGSDALFSLPLKKGSDSLLVCERVLAETFRRDQLLAQLFHAYKNAPFFAHTFPLVETLVNFPDDNLFEYLHHSLVELFKHLGITAKLVVSSTVPIDHSLKKEYKVAALCAAVNASSYINAIGGMELYSREFFQERGLELGFIKPRVFEYPQFSNTFVPWLSIIDVLMFNPLDRVIEVVSTNYEIIR